ncbi:hypothetical protein IMZ48_40630 [Candidatus Bathyarchaeota archaeon]|nr:hypothetical protein [Candidatus Bathyarchaeota archaeon]
MHKVCHDWHDEVAVEILARIKEAMRPGYSRLLINENVIPGEKAHWEDTGLDMMMMTLLTSRERTQANWEKLVQEMAGLRIVKIYTKMNGESIVECELAE